MKFEKEKHVISSFNQNSRREDSFAAAFTEEHPDLSEMGNIKRPNPNHNKKDF